MIKGNFRGLAKHTFFWEVYERKDTKLFSNKTRDCFYTFYSWQITSVDIDIALYIKYHKNFTEIIYKGYNISTYILRQESKNA